MGSRKVCCGQVHATAYCPYCGAILVGSPLEELSIYCDRFITLTAMRLSKQEKVQAENPSRPQMARVLSLKRKLEKWKSWKQALEAAIGGEMAKQLEIEMGGDVSIEELDTRAAMDKATRSRREESEAAV